MCCFCRAWSWCHGYACCVVVILGCVNVIFHVPVFGMTTACIGILPSRELDAFDQGIK